MISLSRLIAGIFFILCSIGAFFGAFYESLFLLIYAIPLLIVGLVLLLNKNEDKIEGRIDEKGLNKKKSKV